jgi:transcriptional regulator with GAF, ATPase, and Fis domain
MKMLNLVWDFLSAHSLRAGRSGSLQTMETSARLQLIDGTTPVVRSQAMRELMAMVERVARQDAAVLIVGETGSGKEMIARAIHRHSLRSGKAFVDVNCAAFPEHLIESELFGYEKGAFSGADTTKPGLFELADQGTLLLDEVGELDGKVQAKLLRALDGVSYYRLGGSRKVTVNVRVIAATNRSLEDEVRAGKFREDFYHRLTPFQLRVPPLRERPEDIGAIAEYFLQQLSAVHKISNDAMQVLLRYQWPGNVRELKNVMFKAALQVKPGAKEIRARDLPPEICDLPGGSASPAYQGNLHDMEKQMIVQALARAGDNQAMAAQQLGISARTLRRKLMKYRQQEQAAASQTALGTMNTQQQRYFRVAIETPVLLDWDGKQVKATSVNVSSGGLAIQSQTVLPHGSVMQISFTLPETTSAIEAKAKVSWTGQDGLVGLNIVQIHPALDRELQQWVLERARTEGWLEPSAEQQ